MISKFGLARIKELERKGVILTPERIIKLNALALEIERVDAEWVTAPRVALAGTTALHELTMQAERWYREYAGKWWDGEDLVVALAWCNAHARQRGFFRAWLDEDATRKAINRWARELDCTREEFHRAYAYVNDAPWRVESGEGEGEVGSGSGSGQSEEQETEDGEGEGAVGSGSGQSDEQETGDGEQVEVWRDAEDTLSRIAHEVVAAGLGLSRDEIELSTRGELVDILYRWSRNRLHGGVSRDKVVARIKHSASAKFYKYFSALLREAGENG